MIQEFVAPLALCAQINSSISGLHSTDHGNSHTRSLTSLYRVLVRHTYSDNWDVVRRCDISWNSTCDKFQRDIDHINADLVPHVKTVITNQRSIATIAQTFWELACNTPSCLDSMLCLEKQNKETTCRINDLIKGVPEWGSVPQSVHDGLNVCTTKLAKQRMDLALLYFLSEPTPENVQE